MPNVLHHGPYRFFFFSREGNEPVYVHIEREDMYAKFWLGPIRLAKSGGFSARELRIIGSLVEEYESLIKEKWDEHFGS